MPAITCDCNLVSRFHEPLHQATLKSDIVFGE